jgi:hypothetical protein
MALSRGAIAYAGAPHCAAQAKQHRVARRASRWRWRHGNQHQWWRNQTKMKAMAKIKRNNGGGVMKYRKSIK